MILYTKHTSVVIKGPIYPFFEGGAGERKESIDFLRGAQGWRRGVEGGGKIGCLDHFSILSKPITKAENKPTVRKIRIRDMSSPGGNFTYHIAGQILLLKVCST